MRTMGEHIDCDVSGILPRDLTIPEAGDALIDMVIRTSGRRLRLEGSSRVQREVTAKRLGYLIAHSNAYLGSNPATPGGAIRARSTPIASIIGRTRSAVRGSGKSGCSPGGQGRS